MIAKRNDLRMKKKIIKFYGLESFGTEGEEEDVSPEEFRVSFEISRIAAEIFVWPELLRVDEDRGDNVIRLRARAAHQRQVAFVQRAHGRHQRDPPCSLLA